jgi:hypothetical protein
MTDQRYRPRSRRDVVALIDAYPLGWVISRDFEATLLPLLAETDDEGGLCALLGHVPVSNPQRLTLERDPDVLILFLGANGYISPRLVSDPRGVPPGTTQRCVSVRELSSSSTRPTSRCGCSPRTSSLTAHGQWSGWARGTSASDSMSWRSARSSTRPMPGSSLAKTSTPRPSRRSRRDCATPSSPNSCVASALTEAHERSARLSR